MNAPARRLAALATGLALLFAASPAAAKPSDPKAIELGKRGNEQFKEGDYESAKESFEAAYEIEPDPAFLFGVGQTLNQMGDCKGAIRKYNQVKDSQKATPELREVAEQAILFCAEKVAEEPEDEPGEEPEAEPLEQDPIEPVDGEPAPPVDEQPRARKWYQDPLGDTLVAVGLAGTGAGVGLLVAAQLQQGKQKDAPSYEDFDARGKRVRTLRIAGGVTLGIGGALLVSGVIRWAVLGLRAPKRSSAQVGVLYDGRTSGLSLSGRF